QRRRRAAAEPISPPAGRYSRARLRRGISEPPGRDLASKGLRGNARSEPPAVERWSGRAAAVSGPAGGRRRKRSGRPSASRGGSAAGDLYRLELPKHGNRGDGAVVPIDRWVHS